MRLGHPWATITGMAELVSTSEAARQLGVNRRTLQRWVAEGQIRPDWTTPGGHARWDVERLRRQVQEPGE